MALDQYVIQVKKATDYIQSFLAEKKFHPTTSITLGSGLGKLANLIKPVATIPYKDIPHFPTLTVPGHEGTLIAGYLEGVPLLGFKGRKHYYEVAHLPNAMDQVVFYVQSRG